MFYISKCPFAGIAKYLCHTALLASNNAVIKILEDATQALRQSPAYAGLAGSHKSNQEQSPHRDFARRTRPLHSRSEILPSLRACSGTLSSALQRANGISLLCRYCDFAVRFLRWILPLKLRSTTVEETAA